MKFKNTSKFPTPFVRKMLSWCIRELGIPVRRNPQLRCRLRSVTFRNRSKGWWSGHAWSSGRIVVSINKDGDYTKPHKWSGYTRACKPADGSDYLEIIDAVEALVAVTLHELGHVSHFARGHTGRGSEEMADAMARKAMRDFREQREALMAVWSDAVEQQPQKSTVTAADRREAKARLMFDRWQRKLALAKTKLAVYRRKVEYYERKAASKSN